MVRLVYLLCMLLSPVLAATASLNVELSSTQVEMGKYLSVKIKYVGNNDPGLSDLQQWREQFFIERQDVNVESLISGEIQTVDHLRLFPRQVGALVLDAIALGGAIAKPLKVSVVPTVRSGIDGTPRVLPLPARVWQGEEVSLTVEVALLHPANELSVQQIPFPGFSIARYSSEKKSVNGIDVVALHWQLIPKVKGRYRLELPPVVQRGRGRWKFYLPRSQLEIVPLPSYLPPTVAIGKLAMQTRLQQQGDQLVWQLLLSNKGPLPKELYGVRATLARVADADPEDIVLSTTGATQLYQVAVPSWSWGWGKGPEITLRYFDTESGKLKILVSYLPAVWRVPGAVLTVLVLLAAVITGLLLLLIYKYGKRVVALRRYRQLLAQTSDAHELRQRLLQAEGERTLSAWSAHQHDGAARKIAEQLNGLCFASKSEWSFADVRQAAIASLRTK